MSKKKKEKIILQNQIENINDLILQYVGHFFDTFEKIKYYLEQRDNFIEQLRNEEENDI